MKFIKNAWDWIMKHSVLIIVGLLVFVYAYVSLQSIEHEQSKSDDDFKCQTLCFPQQHEYLYAGEVGSCWCYSSSDELERYKE